MAPNETGTIISGYVGMHWFVWVFVSILLGMILVSGFVGLLSGEITKAISFPLVGLIFLVFTVGASRLLSRDDEKFLTEFLLSAVEGRIQPDPTATLIAQDR